MTKMLRKRRKAMIALVVIVPTVIILVYGLEYSRCLTEARKVASGVRLGMSIDEVTQDYGEPYRYFEESSGGDSTENYDYPFPYWWSTVHSQCFSSSRTMRGDPLVRNSLTCRVVFSKNRVVKVLIKRSAVGNTYHVLRSER